MFGLAMLGEVRLGLACLVSQCCLQRMHQVLTLVPRTLITNCSVFYIFNYHFYLQWRFFFGSSEMFGDAFLSWGEVAGLQ